MWNQVSLSCDNPSGWQLFFHVSIIRHGTTVQLCGKMRSTRDVFGYVHCDWWGGTMEMWCWSVGVFQVAHSSKNYDQIQYQIPDNGHGSAQSGHWRLRRPLCHRRSLCQRKSLSYMQLSGHCDSVMKMCHCCSWTKLNWCQYGPWTASQTASLPSTTNYWRSFYLIQLLWGNCHL